jgi:hypothetical protein
MQTRIGFGVWRGPNVVRLHNVPRWNVHYVTDDFGNLVLVNSHALIRSLSS